MSFLQLIKNLVEMLACICVHLSFHWTPSSKLVYIHLSVSVRRQSALFSTPCSIYYGPARNHDSPLVRTAKSNQRHYNPKMVTLSFTRFQKVSRWNHLAMQISDLHWLCDGTSFLDITCLSILTHLQMQLFNWMPSHDFDAQGCCRP